MSIHSKTDLFDLQGCIADAKSRAVATAKLLGKSLGKVVYLQENSAPSYSFPRLGLAKAKAGGGIPEIDLGEEEVTGTITVRWATYS